MKYSVKYSCGHEDVVDLYGKSEERRKKIDYFEAYGLCPSCYKERKEIDKGAGCDEVEMSYREYKQSYASCKTKAGSYDGRSKTIIVYVPKEVAK